LHEPCIPSEVFLREVESRLTLAPEKGAVHGKGKFKCVLMVWAIDHKGEGSRLLKVVVGNIEMPLGL